jgi:uncharacterized protein YukE
VTEYSAFLPDLEEISGDMGTMAAKLEGDISNLISQLNANLANWNNSAAKDAYEGVQGQWTQKAQDLVTQAKIAQSTLQQCYEEYVAAEHQGQAMWAQ